LPAGCPAEPTVAQRMLCAALWHRADGSRAPGLNGIAGAVSRAIGETLVGVG
jgi:hypothetical protein